MFRSSDLLAWLPGIHVERDSEVSIQLNDKVLTLASNVYLGHRTEKWQYGCHMFPFSVLTPCAFQNTFTCVYLFDFPLPDWKTLGGLIVSI